MGKFKQSFCIPCFWESPKPEHLRKLITRAAKIGYPAFELWGRDDTFKLVCQLAKDNGMTIASTIGHGPGLNDRKNHQAARDELLASIELAQKNGIPNLICFSGDREGKNNTECVGITAEGLSLVKAEAEAADVMLNLELLNSKVDHPGYQCDRTDWGVAVVKQVNSPKVKLLYDIYHMQIMEGDLCRTIKDNIQYIGHMHTAGNPGRNDMDETQEIYYPAVVKAILDTGYDRYVAHEFMPKGDKLKALETAFRLFDQV